jgi:hypothetical protein
LTIADLSYTAELVYTADLDKIAEVSDVVDMGDEMGAVVEVSNTAYMDDIGDKSTLLI